MATIEKLKNAILKLLSGQSNSVNPQNGNPIGNQPNNDKFGTTYYNNEKSLPKHITSKERLENYNLEGMRQTIDIGIDQQTQLPLFTINTLPQSNYPLNNETNEGAVDNVPLDQITAKKVAPTDYLHNPQIQSIVNSVIVSMANSLSEAIIKVLMAKIESNFTEFTIKFDPNAEWSFSNLNAGSVFIKPGNAGVINEGTGTLKFNGEYTHKCKVKISDLQ